MRIFEAVPKLRTLLKVELVFPRQNATSWEPLYTFWGPISEPRQGVWDMAGLNRIFQTVSEMSEIAIQGSKKSCSRLMSRLPLAFDASRCIHACSGNLKRYNVDDVRSRRLQARPPRPSHFSNALQAMIFEPRALQLKAVELFLFSP